MSEKAVKLNFMRYEFKYIMSEEVTQAVEAEISKFMALDPYVAQQEDKYYVIRSLYFDDLSYSKYYDKVDGMKKREKFRVRTYTTDYDTHADAYLEIKGRYNAVTYKERTPIEHGNEFFQNLAENQTIEEILRYAVKSAVKDRFTWDLGTSTMRPIMVIDYKRRPYVHPNNPGLRITFDKELMAKPAISSLCAQGLHDHGGKTSGQPADMVLRYRAKVSIKAGVHL